MTDFDITIVPDFTQAARFWQAAVDQALDDLLDATQIADWRARSERLEELFATPIGQQISALQDGGRDIYIAAWNDTHALIVDVDGEQVTVAPHGQVHGIGRWECSKAHYQHHTSIYHERFPTR